MRDCNKYIDNYCYKLANHFQIIISGIPFRLIQVPFTSYNISFMNNWKYKRSNIFVTPPLPMQKYLSARLK